jgi:hypothetical protein
MWNTVQHFKSFRLFNRALSILDRRIGSLPVSVAWQAAPTDQWEQAPPSGLSNFVIDLYNNQLKEHHCIEDLL